MSISSESFALQQAEKGDFTACCKVIQDPSGSIVQKKAFSEKFLTLLCRKLESSLLDDIKQGKVRIEKGSSHVFLKKYPEIEKMLSLITNYLSQEASQKSVQHVVNRAKIESELFRLEKNIASRDAFIEQTIITALNQRNTPPSKEECRCIQQNQLRTILHTDLSSLSLEGIEQLLRVLHKKSYLIAYKVPEDEQESWLKVLDVFASKCTELVSKRTELYEKELRFPFSSLIQEKGVSLHLRASFAIMQEIINNIDYLQGISEKLVETITKHKKGDTVDRAINEFAMELGLRITEFLSTDRFIIQHDHQFLRKWGTYLVAEMKQGFPDESEITRGGSCWAISLRWVAKELAKDPKKNDQDFIKNELQIGSIHPQDRLHQVLYLRDASFIEFAEWHEPHGIQVVFDHLGLEHKKDFQIQKDAQGSFKEGLSLFINSDEFQKNYGGVAQIGPQSHAICIHVYEDPENASKNIFRINDPNWGTFQLQNKQQFIECLLDLFGDTILVSAHCYKTTMPKKSLQKSTIAVFHEPPHAKLKRQSYEAGQQGNEEALKQLTTHKEPELRDLIIKHYLYGVSVALGIGHLQKEPSFLHLFNQILSLNDEQALRQTLGILFEGSLADRFLSRDADVVQAAHTTVSSLSKETEEKQNKILKYIITHFVRRSPGQAVLFINQMEPQDRRKEFFDIMAKEGLTSISSLPLTTPSIKKDELFLRLATALLETSLKNSFQAFMEIQDKRLIATTFLKLQDKIVKQDISTEEALMLLCMVPYLELVSRNQFIQSLSPLIFESITDEVVNDFSTKYPFIKSIDLHLCPNVTGKSLMNLEWNCDLEHLAISGSHITDKDIENMLVRIHPKLKSLDLSGQRCEITSEAIRKVINECKQLSYINLTGCIKISQEEFSSLVEGRNDLMIIDKDGEMVF